MEACRVYTFLVWLCILCLGADSVPTTLVLVAGAPAIERLIVYATVRYGAALSIPAMWGRPTTDYVRHDEGVRGAARQRLHQVKRSLGGVT